jgi:hypothetical protein
MLIGTAPATVSLHRSEIRKLKPYGSAGFQLMSKMLRATLPQAEQIAYFSICLSTFTGACAHREWDLYLTQGLVDSARL